MTRHPRDTKTNKGWFFLFKETNTDCCLQEGFTVPNFPLQHVQTGEWHIFTDLIESVHNMGKVWWYNITRGNNRSATGDLTKIFSLGPALGSRVKRYDPFTFCRQTEWFKLYRCEGTFSRPVGRLNSPNPTSKRPSDRLKPPKRSEQSFETKSDRYSNDATV